MERFIWLSIDEDVEDVDDADGDNGPGGWGFPSGGGWCKLVLIEDNDDVDIVDGGVDDTACNELSTA